MSISDTNQLRIVTGSANNDTCDTSGRVDDKISAIPAPETFRDKNGANLPSKFLGLERLNASGYVVSTAGTEFQNSTTMYVAIVGLPNGNTMFCYRDQADSGRGKLKIYDPFGAVVKAATIFEVGAAAYISVAVLTSGHVVIAFQDSDDSNIGKAVVYTQDGVLVQSPVEFEPGNTQNTKVVALTNGDYMVAYTDASSGSHGKYTIIKEDKTIVKAPTTFNATSTVNIAALTMTNGNVMIAFPDAADSQNGAYLILDEDGVIVLAKTSFEASDTDFISLSNFTNGHVMIAFQDDGDGDVGKAIIVSNEGVLVKAAVEFESNVVEDVDTATLSTGNILICWKEQFDKGYFAVYDVRLEIVQEKTLFETDKINYLSVAALTTGDFVAAYQNDDTSDRGHYTIFKPSPAALGKIVVVTASSYQVTANNEIIFVDRTTTGTCTINIPAAQYIPGRPLEIIDSGKNATTYNITVVATINKLANLVLNVDGESAALICKSATEWWVH